MIYLTKDDLKQLEHEKNLKYKYVNLSSGNYHMKCCDQSNMVKELFGKKIANIIGLSCPDYQYITEANCILSKNIKIDHTFFWAHELGIDGTTLKNIGECLEFQKANYNRFTNVQEIMFQVYLMHFMDIIFSNIDRSIVNFGFKLNDDNTGYLAIIDHGEMFDHFNLATRPLSFEKAGNLDYTAYTKVIEFKCFISKMAPELLRVFEQLFLLFEPKKIKLMIEQIETENNLKLFNKKEILKNYKINYKGLSKVLKKDVSLRRKKQD